MIGRAAFLFPAARIDSAKRATAFDDEGLHQGVGDNGLRHRSRSGSQAEATQEAILNAPMDVTRDRAWETLTRYTQSEALRRHALAVEACVGFYAREYGEDEELWRAAALLHDFDYEIHPTLDEHPQDGAPILREEGWPDEVVEPSSPTPSTCRCRGTRSSRRRSSPATSWPASCTPAGSCARTGSRPSSRSR